MQCPICGYINKPRTKPQNDSYWLLIITPLARYLSLTNDECHDLMKYKFNKQIHYVPNRQGGMEEIIKIKSTTIMSTFEFNEHCENIRIWASQLEPPCYLYEPNEAPLKAEA